MFDCGECCVKDLLIAPTNAEWDAEPDKKTIEYKSLGVPSQKRTGLIIGIVIGVIVVVGLAYFFIFSTGAGGGLSSTPIYTGVTENKTAGALAENRLAAVGFSGLDVGVYTSQDNSSAVADWYQSSMNQAGWTKENEISSHFAFENEGSGSYENYTLCSLLYKRGSEGSMIMVAPPSSSGFVETGQGTVLGMQTGQGTVLATITGSWEKVSDVWDNIYGFTEISSTPVRSMSVENAAIVYDYDSSAQNNDYKNGNVSITLVVNSGTFRNIGDPSYGGTTITVINPATGFSGSVMFGDTTDWGSTMSKSTNIAVSSWTAPNNYVTMKVEMNPDSQGNLTAGSAISITLQPFGQTDAHAGASSRMANAEMWDEQETLNVTITSRDSVTLTGFDGAYLIGTPWTA